MSVANPKNKRILFLINSLARGGAERVFVNQANYLAQEGYTVYLATFAGPKPNDLSEELELPAEQVFHYPTRRFIDLKILLALRRLVRRHDIGLVYSTLERPNIMSRLLKLLCPRLRVVIREGSALADEQGRTKIKETRFKILDLMLNWLPAAIIAVSPEIESLLKSYQLSYARKIKLLENGVSIIDSPSDIEKRWEDKVNRAEFFVLAVASMNYYERAFEYLIDAVALLPPELRERTELVFAGDGTLRPVYEAQTKKLGLGNRIKFLGRLATEAVREEYRRADAFVLCSTTEGSPNVILEAMAFGLPVITTPVGSAVNMVKEGETGLFIPFKNAQAIADKITWLATHPVERLNLGLAGYHRATSHYSFNRKMKELQTILGLSD